jgi:hypothetical protein
MMDLKVRRLLPLGIVRDSAFRRFLRRAFNGAVIMDSKASGVKPPGRETDQASPDRRLHKGDIRQAGLRPCERGALGNQYRSLFSHKGSGWEC